MFPYQPAPHGMLPSYASTPQTQVPALVMQLQQPPVAPWVQQQQPQQLLQQHTAALQQQQQQQALLAQQRAIAQHQLMQNQNHQLAAMRSMHANSSPAIIAPQVKCANPTCQNVAHPGFAVCSQDCDDVVAALPKCATPGCTRPPCAPYQFCSRTCALSTPQASAPTCLNCSKPRASGFLHCSKRCALAAPACGAATCQNLAQSGMRFCSATCAASAGLSANTLMRRLPCKPTPYIEASTKAKAAEIEQQFLDKWMSGTKGTVKAVFDVFPAKKVDDNFALRQAAFVAKNVVPFGRAGPGNACRRFHATTLKCSLGQSGVTTPCTDATCAVCSIISGGFLLSKAGANAGTRFGPGMYFSASSNKSHGYSRTVPVGNTKLRAMLVCLVLAGKAFMCPSTSLASGPDLNTYDSLVADTKVVGVGADELVVFKEDQALPYYLILYEA